MGIPREWGRRGADMDQPEAGGDQEGHHWHSPVRRSRGAGERWVGPTAEGRRRLELSLGQGEALRAPGQALAVVGRGRPQGRAGGEDRAAADPVSTGKSCCRVSVMDPQALSFVPQAPGVRPS